MKSQYVGDIGDYGKVLILKHFSKLGFRLGINWLLTPADGGADGKHRDYANYIGKDCLCACDEAVFDRMLSLACSAKETRRIDDLEQLIRYFCEEVSFFSHEYADRRERRAVDGKALTALSPERADLIFFDPDNGISLGNDLSEKHVYLPELKKFWDRGQSLLIYHHLGRVGSHQQQLENLKEAIAIHLKTNSIKSYRLCRGTARAYFLVLQQEHSERVREPIQSIVPLQSTKMQWARQSVACSKHR